MLKQGYDHFEVTRLEPKLDICDRHYVFNAQASGKFSPADRCPAYTVPQEIASAVRDKERRDESQLAQLVARGVPTAATSTGGQGGMNATFLAAVRAHGGPGSDIRTASGTIPGHVHPPAEPSPGLSTGSLFSFAAPASRPAQAQVASAGSMSGGLLGSVSGPSRETHRPPTTSQPGATTAKPVQTAASGKTMPTADKKAAATPKPLPPQPQPQPQKTASAEAEARPASTGSVLNGAAPTVPAGSFGSGFGFSR
jgi:hypothetical protein